MQKTARSTWPLLYATALLALTTGAIAQSAANYPNKPVRILTGYAAGGASSQTTKIFGDRLAKDLGQPFIVENRPGGNTVIASEALVRSAPDGHTLLMVTNTHIMNPFMQPNLPYDTLKDFAAVSPLVRNDHMLAVHPSVPAGNLKDLIGHLKKNPDKVNSVVAGIGSHNHVQNMVFMRATDTRFTVVPYKGAATAIGDLLTGRVQMYITNPSVFAPHIKTGKLTGIAVSGSKRNALVPDIPTFTEAGLKGFTATNYYLLLAPGQTPRDIVQKLNTQVAKAQASPDVLDLLAKQGVDPFPSAVADTEALIRADMERLGRVIRENNIKAEED